jgi:hypothetical protein
MFTFSKNLFQFFSNLGSNSRENIELELKWNNRGTSMTGGTSNSSSSGKNVSRIKNKLNEI